MDRSIPGRFHVSLPPNRPLAGLPACSLDPTGRRWKADDGDSDDDDDDDDYDAPSVAT